MNEIHEDIFNIFKQHPRDALTVNVIVRYLGGYEAYEYKEICIACAALERQGWIKYLGRGADHHVYAVNG